MELLLPTFKNPSIGLLTTCLSSHIQYSIRLLCVAIFVGISAFIGMFNFVTFFSSHPFPNQPFARWSKGAQIRKKSTVVCVFESRSIKSR